MTAYLTKVSGCSDTSGVVVEAVWRRATKGFWERRWGGGGWDEVFGGDARLSSLGGSVGAGPNYGESLILVLVGLRGAPLVASVPAQTSRLRVERWAEILKLCSQTGNSVASPETMRWHSSEAAAARASRRNELELVGWKVRCKGLWGSGSHDGWQLEWGIWQLEWGRWQLEWGKWQLEWGRWQLEWGRCSWNRAGASPVSFL